jgi:hypothetical protein
MNITYAQWAMGRDVKYPPSQAIRDNANELLRRVNKLLIMYNLATDEVVTQVNSGYRPLAINQATPGASLTSLHITGEAIDLSDPQEELDTWLMSAQGKVALEECDLFQEHPSKSPRWCHLGSRKFRSYVAGGSRTFMP